VIDSQISEDHTGTIVLRPNQSWTWRYNLYLLYTLLTVSLIMGVFFIYVGAWVILPFSLLELSVLLACMYYCLRRAQRQEVIRVTAEHVTIERGRREPEATKQFIRFWAQFVVTPARHPWSPCQVSIRSHGEEMELGGFLNKEEKSQLVSELRRVVPPV
jgi:uncharacterized membrane protein